MFYQTQFWFKLWSKFLKKYKSWKDESSEVVERGYVTLFMMIGKISQLYKFQDKHHRNLKG